MSTNICTDCERLRLIVLKFKAVVNGRTTEVQLCRGCLRKRYQAKKPKS